MPPTPSFFFLPRQTWVLLALVCAVHFLLGAQLGLSVDEAHYALYAAHLDWSYFDHPPLVGWVQWPLVALNAPTWVLRLLPELLWLGTAFLVHGLAQRVQALQRGATPAASAAPAATATGPAPGQAGFWAVLVLAVSPLFHVLGIGLLPDTLLVFLTAAVLVVTLDLMRVQALQRGRPWLLLGLLLGLAGLSKYTAIFTALAVVLCLLSVHGWQLLRLRWPWLAVTLAVVLVLPVLYWNQSQQWISFRYQAQHGAGGGWSGLAVGRFLVIQLIAYGPLLLAGLMGLRGATMPAARAMLVFFAVPFAVLAVLAGGGTSLPHWTAPAWVALAPLGGLALARTGQAWLRWATVALALVQAAVCLVLLGLMLSAGQPFVTQTSGQGNNAAPSNPFADVHGWDLAGERARTLAQQLGLPSVSVQNWTLASRLAWYARPLPVHVLEDRFDQFTLWAGALPAGGDTLLLDWSQLGYTLPLAPHGFADCRLLDTQEVRRLGAPVATFRFFACHGWSGQPQPRLMGAAP